MDQVANLVFDLGMDSQKFRDEMPRVVKILQNASGESARAEARLKRFIESQNKASQEATAGAEVAVSAEGRQRQAVALTAQSYAQMSQRVDLTQRHIAALNQKLQEEAAKAAAVAQAQDAAAAAFYRQIDSVKQLSGGLQELQRIQAQVRQAKGRGDISQGDYLALVSEAAAKTRELTDAEALATQKKAQFIRRLKEQTAVQGLSRTELLRVKAAELGVSSAADVYIRKLDTATKSTHALGLKSAMARREIGVLIGELARGNFGALRGSGITLANRAGWIEQLMSPKGMMLGGLVGGVAAAVYGLGKAYYEGAKESEEFNKQLILTGSYAGKTTGKLNEMAKSLAGNGVTQHDAAGVLTQVVGSGAFTGQAVAMVSRTAARMQENVGQSVDETIRQFKRLQDDPVNAAKELDRALHFLTATQLEQIRVLGEQGRTADAAKIAMSAYSEEMNKRAGDVHDNLGWIEKAWNAVGDAAKWAWDRMLDIGREDTLDEKIATLQEKIARDRKTPWTVSSSQTEYDQQQLNELQEQKRQKDLLDAKAQAERNYQKTQKRRNEQNAALNRDNETESLRHQREVARITAMQYADAAVRNAALERENERHKKAMARQKEKPKAYHNDEAGRLLLQYSQQQAQTEGLIAAAKLSTTEKMTEAHKQLLSFQQRIADLSGKKLTADEQSVLAHKDEIALALQKLDISQQDLQHQNAFNELKKKTLTLTSQLADEGSRVRQQHALALATMGMGDQQRGRYEEHLKIQQHYQEQLEQLKRDSKAKGTYGSDEYRQAEQELQASLDRRLAEWADYNAKVDAAQGDWTQGASRALDNFLAQGGNVAGMTENVFTNAFNGMADSIANFSVTGKGSFRSLTVSILADLAKMEARIAASKLLGSVLGMFGFGASAGGSTPSGAYSSAALSVIPNADGGVYRSAGLSQYSGSIVNRPTFFAFARGAAVMGEAGPEAILPLRRGTDGKLGVVAAGSGGMAMFAPQYHIAISNTGPELTPQALKAVYDLGKKAAADFVQQQGRDGGRLSGAYR
ncbi:phage tail tape measure protein [Salmonella enterica subsp. enterica serovar Bovismorbificans]|uniref:Phage tail tape measure protein n=9 Tax=Salmonella enterica TaxID=28901 RepID=A0A724NKQ6_SALEP|nr:phage tail tape measure protein [Salmonella enterica]ECI4813978.1 phage tail tape measure protein [Salmonella enterica subsp. enterica]ECQ6468019.1 phage tail tape measure protein [Salmonella enterica subsp. enterica serovar Java]EDG5408287.1 phage tail tape measure protein [Salmonella enterica subsp. enterica serovar Bovismorbificans]EDQ8561559.1 phage tail tape measure protein [Salmonella enterica subsp. enterica serovar Amager]EEN3030728.1 phage tail tape measure protein [Salmonella ente